MAWCKLREFLVWRDTCITQVAAGNMEIWGVGWSNVQLIVFRVILVKNWHVVSNNLCKRKRKPRSFFCQISFSFYRLCFCHRVSRCVKVRISGLSSSMGGSWHGTPESRLRLDFSHNWWDFYHVSSFFVRCRVSYCVHSLLFDQ